MLRRLLPDELFRADLEPIGDATLDLRLNEIERRMLARQSEPGYAEAVAEETLQQPEAVG